MKPQPRIHLACWDAAECARRATLLRAAGYRVATDPLSSIKEIRALRDDPPAAVLIDLSRTPSRGRDVGIAIRHQKPTRQVALVFVEGEPEKVARVREILPDAGYTSWRGVRGALKRALARPLTAPVTPVSVMEHYAGAPLPKKLGIKPGMVLTLIDAPSGFEALIGPLPPGVDLRRGSLKAATASGERAGGRRGGAAGPGPSDHIIWFVTNRKSLTAGIRGVAGGMAAKGGLWIAWRKKTSGAATDVSFREVQRAGLAHGLVDFKIAAVDPTWSALRFARKKGR
jgi:hypothetical protein